LSLEARLLTGLAVALALAYWTTPLAIRVADRFQFYDRPAGYKGHGRPTPYLGGAAVVAAFLVAFLALTGDWDKTLPVAGGVGLLWLIGTIDDRRTVTPGFRVAVEAGLGALLWQLGLGWELGAGPLVDVAVTALWIVAVVNAFNLFDNMDGAASSMAGVVAAALAVLGVVEGDSWLAVSGAALSGACLGFLPHNLMRSPARIFLGDGGSMPIGFAIAALTMVGVSGAAAEWQSLAMGVMFVGVPALDTALVVFSRTRRGIPVLTGGRDHLTHRTQARLRTARGVAVALGGAQAVTSALALVALEGGSGQIVAAVLVYVLAVGVAIAVLDARYEHAGAVEAAPRRRSGLELAAPAVLVPLAAVAGLSPFAAGYYSSGLWVPAGLVAVTAVTGLAIARPVRPGRPAWLALAGLSGLGILALVSALWSDSIQQAVVDGNRLLVYAVVLGGLLLLVRSDRAAAWLMGGFAGAALVVAAVVVVRMLGTDGSGLFVAGRLDQPLGYINGEASLFLLALWPCLALAEQRRSALLAAGGAAAATLLGSLVLLSQSRGAAVAALAAGVAVFAIVPGRLRRAWALLLAGAGVVLAAPQLLDVFHESATGGPTDSTVREAAVAALAAAAAVALVWWLAIAATARAGSRRLAVAGLCVVALLGSGLALANAGRITTTLEQQYRAFVHVGLEPQGSGVASAPSSRLVSGAGNRYDYWRTAWATFKEAPVTGVGAGNFDREWFAKRTTLEDIRQPHSIQLQALAELGLLGGAVLALLILGVAWGAWRTARRGVASNAARGVAVAGVGVLTAWLAHTSVDWIHLLPGVTAGALIAAAVLLRDPRATEVAPGLAPRGGRRPTLRVLAASLAVAAVLATAGLSLMRQGMSELFLGRAEAALADRPADTIVEADRALRLDPEAVRAYYAKAAAFARFGEASAARETLLEAARREPRKFVTWALLGDLAVRSGDLKLASAMYGRASALNPRDPALRALVRDPTSAGAPAVDG
jgi:UDP-GlcNAc:undecaprenyl-phosphate GlcNAc-1-phosphate transferase